MFKDTMPVEYSKFQPIIRRITSGNTDLRPIGEGAESKVWRAQIESNYYAIKIAKEGAVNGRGRLMDRGLMTEGRIQSGVAALGVTGLEQFVAGSTEDCAAIFQFVDGVRLTDFKSDSLDLVTANQKDRLAETIAAATEIGLAFDYANPSGANAFYNPSIGFTLIDYKQTVRQISYEENWANAMRSLGPVALRAFTR